MVIKIGTRPSRLALTQAEEVIKNFPGIDFEIIPIDTKGDKDKVSSLSGYEKSDFFTAEIEKALIENRIDAAVHSAKDLECEPPQELIIAVLTYSISPYECLVSKSGLGLAWLPPGSVIGTSSLKRKLSVLRFRKDLIVKDIRGNIDERLDQLDRGAYDAIIVAHAALLRLKCQYRITEIISPSIIEPHPLQGRLAIEVRKDRKDIIDLFGGINGTR